ncbi:MAG: hypothetical protein WBG86_09925 [Polyangiales bacterium]
MFRIRKLGGWERNRGSIPPRAYEDGSESLRPIPYIAELRRQLGAAIAEAAVGERRLFLRVLGADLDSELQQLASRMAFGVGEEASEVAERFQMLSEMVGYFCDAVARWTRRLRTRRAASVWPRPRS